MEEQGVGKWVFRWKKERERERVNQERREKEKRKEERMKVLYIICLLDHDFVMEQISLKLI